MAIAVTSGFTNYASINRSGSLSGYNWQSAGQAKTNNDFYTWIQGTVAAESGEGYFDYIGGSGLSNNTIPSNPPLLPIMTTPSWSFILEWLCWYCCY